MTRKQIELLTEIGNKMSAEIKKETGATVEVTIRDGLMIYTETLDKIEAIKNLLDQVAEYVRESFYEADDDMPAGITLFYNS